MFVTKKKFRRLEDKLAEALARASRAESQVSAALRAAEDSAKRLADALVRPAQGEPEELKRLLAIAAEWAARPDSRACPDCGDWASYYASREAADLLGKILDALPVSATGEKENS